MGAKALIDVALVLNRVHCLFLLHETAFTKIGVAGSPAKYRVLDKSHNAIYSVLSPMQDILHKTSVRESSYLLVSGSMIAYAPASDILSSEMWSCDLLSSRITNLSDLHFAYHYNSGFIR